MPEIANAWLRAGVCDLGDSRVENIQRMKASEVASSMTLIRTPMLSQVTEVVRLTNVSFNTELSVIIRLSAEAEKTSKIHGIVLMVELGDLREGIMPDLLESEVGKVLCLPNIVFMGIGTNLACRSGVSPDQYNMAKLTALANSIDAKFGPIVKMISGGNSANLDWALSQQSVGRINNLRLGEAMLLGCEPLFRKPVPGLSSSAIILVAEVIELKDKPSKPWGNIAQTAFGVVEPSEDKGMIKQAILAIGRQDTDTDGLIPPDGVRIIAASSDHLIVDVSDYKGQLKVGSEVCFQLDYSALLRSMTSPFILKFMK